MSLRLVYGRAGTGKSEYCFREMKEKVENKQQVFVISPEQFSFISEKKLLEALKEKAVFQAEVLSFERMGYRVLQEVGGLTKVNLSSSGKAMLIYDKLSHYQKELIFLGKSEENVQTVERMLTELKKHTISLEQLQKEIEKQKDPYLKLKLKDICFIYEKVQDKLQGHFLDENEIVTILKEHLAESHLVDGTDIYIDEFAGFTTQEYEVIRKLLTLANRVTITVCSDGTQIGKNPDSDVFYANKKTIETLYQIAKEEGVEIEKEVVLDKPFRFQKKELLHLEQNLYQFPYQIYEEEPKNLSLWLSQNYYTEIEKVAYDIVKKVKEEGYRYQDITVMTKNMATYSSIIKAVFQQYHIPYFLDEKKDFSQNILAQYLLSIFQIFSASWSFDSVMQYMKSGFLDMDLKEQFELENYTRQWGVKGKKWYEKDWTYGAVDEEEQKKVARWNELRKNIVIPLRDLQQKIQKEKTVGNITKLLYSFLLSQSIDQKVKNKKEQLEKIGLFDLANEYSTAWKKVMDVFDEMVLLFDSEKISMKGYYQLLKAGLQASELGAIPATLDSVIIGDVERSRSHKVKVLYIIGLNDGVFPSVHTEEGFLNDKDREILKEDGIELAKGTLEQIYDDNFNIYKAFSTAEEKLYLSYASSDLEGKSLRASVLLSRIRKIFPKLKEESEQTEDPLLLEEIGFRSLLNNLAILPEKEIEPIWYDLYQYYFNKPSYQAKLSKSLQGLWYSNMPETLKPDLAQKLYGMTLHTTVSRLEQYESCPFSFYLKYGLKLQEEKKFQIQSLDTGSFMHDVVDSFFTRVREEQEEVKTLKQDRIKEIVDEIIQEKLNLAQNYILTSTPKFVALTNQLKKVILKSILYLVEGLKQTDFVVVGNEVEFKKGKEYEPITLSLENGQKVEITGKIDRIDMAKTEKGNYLRIIDYKSSVKNVELNEVMAGIQLQLLTYLDAACQIEKQIPAGILYYSLIDPILNATHSMTKEEMEQEIKKKFKMNGLILADVEVVKMMDHSLEKGASDKIPVYLDKEGNISQGKSNVVTKEQFETLQKYVAKTIQKIAKEIMKGKIDLKPYYEMKNKKTPCEYCSYKGICGFQAGFCQNQYRFIPNYHKSEVLDKMKQELEEE